LNIKEFLLVKKGKKFVDFGFLYFVLAFLVALLCCFFVFVFIFCVFAWFFPVFKISFFFCFPIMKIFGVKCG